ncbi:uncharacterized protein [Ambystoma mexicanum]|uniref:uncharacterized protein n=1 Tax=Ambystoma mexicanum TaxID=8296 RepID=UPI0037E89450
MVLTRIYADSVPYTMRINMLAAAAIEVHRAFGAMECYWLPHYRPLSERLWDWLRESLMGHESPMAEDGRNLQDKLHYLFYALHEVLDKDYRPAEKPVKLMQFLERAPLIETEGGWRKEHSEYNRVLEFSAIVIRALDELPPDVHDNLPQMRKDMCALNGAAIGRKLYLQATIDRLLGEAGYVAVGTTTNFWTARIAVLFCYCHRYPRTLACGVFFFVFVVVVTTTASVLGANFSRVSCIHDNTVGSTSHVTTQRATSTNGIPDGNCLPAGKVVSGGALPKLTKKGLDHWRERRAIHTDSSSEEPSTGEEEEEGTKEGIYQVHNISSHDSLQRQKMASLEQYQELVNAIQGITAELQSIMVENTDLKADNAALRQQIIQREDVRGDLPPMQLPCGKYEGNPKRIKEFLDACRVYFTFHPKMYEFDQAKVGFLVSNLGG